FRTPRDPPSFPTRRSSDLFKYERSLEVIRAAHDYGLITKSNLILGMGETEEEVVEAMRDLREAGTDILTITQYLRPTSMHHPIRSEEHTSELQSRFDIVCR